MRAILAGLELLTFTLLLPTPVISLNGTKCCPGSKILDSVSKECLDSPWASPLSQPIDEGLALDEHSGFPTCGATKFLFNPDPGLESDNTTFASGGQFFVDTNSSEVIEVDTDEHFQDDCIDQVFNEAEGLIGTAAVVCAPNPQSECRGQACVRFCCPIGLRFNQSVGECQDVQSEVELELELPDVDVKKLFGLPECAQRKELSLKDAGYRFDNLTGNLVVQDEVFDHNQYCIDAVEDGNDTWNVAVVCSQQQINQELYDLVILGRDLVRGLFCVSLVFLVTAFVHIYCQNRHKLFGVMTMSMITMLFLFYVFLTIPSFLGPSQVTETPYFCKFNAVSLQFSYLSAMCWLSAMAYDIWNTFRTLSARRPDNQSRGWRHPKFMRYALFAWGLPAAVVIVTIIVDQLPPEQTSGYKIPEIGRTNCFLGDDGVIFYFHIINLPLLLTNAAFFCVSSWNLCCGLWGQSDYVRRPVVGRAKTLFKSTMHALQLFFVMGLTWIAEIISWILLHFYPVSVTIVKASLFFDCLNALQGFTLFCALFFGRATVKKIRNRIGSTMTATRVTITKARSSSLTISANLELGRVSECPNVGVEREQSNPPKGQSGSAQSKSGLASVTFSGDVDQIQAASPEKRAKPVSNLASASASASMPLSANTIDAEKISTFKAHPEGDSSQALGPTLGGISGMFMWNRKRSYDLNR